VGGIEGRGKSGLKIRLGFGRDYLGILSFELGFEADLVGNYGGNLNLNLDFVEFHYWSYF
jgi:hypothetical protein